MAPLLAVAGALLLIAWLGHKWRDSRKPIGPPGDANLSLLVLVYGSSNSHQLLRVEFESGEPMPPEVVWEGSPSFFDTRNQIVDERYVVASTGGVIDVWAKDILRDPHGTLIEVTGGRVISSESNPPRKNSIFAFDLKTRKSVQLAGREEAPYLLPGKRSPDGTKSVETLFTSLTLHRLEHPPRPLGSFHVHQSVLSSNIGNPPVLWLDDARFLTQHGNGNLIAVSLDGTRTPVVEVPAKTEVIGAPRLERDPDGRIIYYCGERFFIDPDAKTWERYESISFGHGFDARWIMLDGEGRSVIRHRGEEIGHVVGGRLRVCLETDLASFGSCWLYPWA